MGARDGSQRSQTGRDPARPTRIVSAGEWLSVRLTATIPDIRELDGMQKAIGSNSLVRLFFESLFEQ